MLTPMAGRNSTPPTKDTVMPIMIQNARRYSRNRLSTTSTMTMASTPFSSSMVMRSSNCSARLLSMRTRMPSGRVVSSSAITDSAASAMSRGDWSPVRNSSISTDGLPLKREWKPVSSKPSRTVAMSPRVTTAPVSARLTTMPENSSAHCLRSLRRSRISPLSVARLPAGTSRLDCSMIDATRSRVRPYSRSASWEISTLVR